MAQNQLERGEDFKNKPAGIVSIILALLGGLVCVIAPLAAYKSESHITGASLWPLPGVALALWALLGVCCAIAVFESVVQPPIRWLPVLIFLTGMFIPLIIIGIFSIGSLVMIGFLCFVASAVILAVQKKAKFLESFGLLMLGAIGNLGLLYVIITLGGSRL